MIPTWKGWVCLSLTRQPVGAWHKVSETERHNVPARRNKHVSTASHNIHILMEGKRRIIPDITMCYIVL